MIGGRPSTLLRAMAFRRPGGYDAAMSPAEPLPAFTLRPRSCAWCRKPLSTLAAVRGDVCDAMDCRRRAADLVTRQRRAAEVDAMREAAAAAWDMPGLAAAPVLWLKHHAEDVAPPDASDIDDLRAHLVALEADDRPPPPPDDDDAVHGAAATAMAANLCALCRGRCCRLGRQGRAFLAPRQLRAWLAERPGATWTDAVDHYIALVPPVHLQHSCLFHGERGCVLPRERRSDVCNDFACDPLGDARRLAASDTAAMAVVGIVESNGVRAAAQVSAQGRRQLPEVRRRD